MWPASMSRGVPVAFTVATELPCTSAVTWSANALTSSRQTRAGAVSNPDGPGVSSSRFRKARVSRVMAWTGWVSRGVRGDGAARCRPPRRSRDWAACRRARARRRGASGGSEPPPRAEWRTAASAGRFARTRSYRAIARSASPGTTPPAAVRGGGVPARDPRRRRPGHTTGRDDSQAARRRIPGRRARSPRSSPPAPALEDHRLLRHVAPEPRANEAHAGTGEQPHRLLGGGLPAVPRVVVGRAHDVEAGPRQGEGGERGRGEHTPGVGNGRRVGGDGAFEVAEGNVRPAQRLEQGPEWIECVTLQQSRPGDAPVEVQVPYCTQPQRVGGPLTRLTRNVHRRHVPRKQHQADHHTVSWPSTSHQRCETLGRVHQTGPRT